MATHKLADIAIIGTGGGCEARMLQFRDMSYLLVTDEGGSSVPEEGEDLMIGYYDKDGEELGVLELRNLG